MAAERQDEFLKEDILRATLAQDLAHGIEQVPTVACSKTAAAPQRHLPIHQKKHASLAIDPRHPTFRSLTDQGPSPKIATAPK